MGNSQGVHCTSQLPSLSERSQVCSQPNHWPPGIWANPCIHLCLSVPSVQRGNCSSLITGMVSENGSETKALILVLSSSSCENKSSKAQQQTSKNGQNGLTVLLVPTETKEKYHLPVWATPWNTSKSWLVLRWRINHPWCLSTPWSRSANCLGNGVMGNDSHCRRERAHGNNLVPKCFHRQPRGYSVRYSHWCLQHQMCWRDGTFPGSEPPQLMRSKIFISESSAVLEQHRNSLNLWYLTGIWNTDMW